MRFGICGKYCNSICAKLYIFRYMDKDICDICIYIYVFTIVVQGYWIIILLGIRICNLSFHLVE